MLARYAIDIIARHELYRSNPTVRPPGLTLTLKVLLRMT
jgi:hypothetical protein